MTDETVPTTRSRRGVGWSAAFTLASRGSGVVAVPLLLHSLGTDLYAVWVVATALTFVQGAFDFGMSAALTRFVALGTAQGSRGSVVTVLRRVVWCYGALSTMGILVWVLGDRVVDEFEFISAAEAGDAVTLLRYAAVAFVVTNANLVLGATLQGLGRVDLSFRSQTIGSLTFIPSLVGLGQVVSAADAVGIATVGMYTVMFMQMAPLVWRELARVPAGVAEAPTWNALLGLGGRWQVSNWADLATFQAPRIVAGMFLTSQSLVVLDLSVRLGQVICAPLAITYPVILPRLTSELTLHGRAGASRLLQSWVERWGLLVIVGGAIAIPSAPLAVELWGGISLDVWAAVACGSVVAGLLGHAATGIFSSALLARGSVGQVVRYKFGQLLAAISVLPLAASFGGDVFAASLGLIVGIPAIWFIRRASAEMDVEITLPTWMKVFAGGLGSACIGLSASMSARPPIEAFVAVLALGAGLAGAVFYLVRRTSKYAP